jgi:hypothetical protein
MEHGRFNVDPLLDEDTESDTPIPSRIMREGDNPRTLHIITGKTSIIALADETIGDTYIGKWKQKTISKKGKEKNRREYLEVMIPLLVQMLNITHHTKRSMIALLPPIMTMEEMEGLEVASTILHHLVVHSSQVRTTYYVTYVYYYFP